MRPSDCPWPVTTETKHVKAFMGQKADKVVFCTYASAHLLKGLRFDFGIFEEAHRTAGRVDALFTFALHDKNIKIKQRVFFTATPKTYMAAVGSDGLETAHSMDGPTYGPTAFTYTLRAAIKDEAICPYKIIAITVNSKQISASLQKARVNPTDSGVDLHAVGCALAIVQACRENDIKKIFTYHRLIKDAQNFATSKVVTDILGEWFQKDQLFTIDGSMNDDQRRKIMANFSAGRRGLISNAKCLAEGVNTPDADAVAILNPKRGKIDIVQTAGRPLRLAKGKHMAYIILPVFIEDSDNKDELHDKLGSSDYASTWDVVAAMAGSDPSLRHELDNFRQTKGQTGSYGDFEALGEFIKISGTRFNIEEMRDAICCRIVEAVSSDWWEVWGEVLAFFKKEGRWPRQHEKNGSWCNSQRQKFKNINTHSDKKYIELKSKGLNFFFEDWDREEWWKIWGEVLALFKKEGRWPRQHEKKGNWVRYQRKEFKDKNTHADPKYIELKSKRFIFVPIEEGWWETWREVQAFYKKEGTWPKRNEKNGAWCNTQRQKFKNKNTRSEEKYIELKSKDFKFPNISKGWVETWVEVKAFFKKNGRWPKRNEKNGAWVSRQRSSRKNKKQNPNYTLMTKAGFSWSPKKDNKKGAPAVG
jgi:superfamily II DNA or RNA helicase